MNDEATVPAQEAAPPPLPLIQDILHKDVVQLIATQPENLMIRGMIRQMLNVAVPKEFFVPGGADKIILFIREWEAKRRATIPPEPEQGIPMSIDLEVIVRGRRIYDRTDRYVGTIFVPLAVMKRASESHTPESNIHRWIETRYQDIADGAYGELNERHGDEEYGDHTNDEESAFNGIRQAATYDALVTYRARIAPPPRPQPAPADTDEQEPDETD